MIQHLTALLAAAAIAVPGAAPAPATADEAADTADTLGTVGAVVRTDLGTVRGLTGDTTRTFRGIPYAAPPVGALRWRPPQPAARWDGVRDATRYADACAQPEHPIGVASTSEDCLYLDVTTPRRPDRNRPVVLWIHGGSFVNGANSVYGPDRLAARGDVVVVQAQYRLGALGFLGDRRLGTNFGLQDQQAAMRWVRRNVAAFGGDPGNVTLLGESAGGYSVCGHLASPAAAGLFQRAVVQSAPCAQEYSATNYAAARPLPVAEKYSRELATKLGCSTVDCLRKVPAARVLEATAEDDFGPVVDGKILPRTPKQALLTGRVNRVPVLHGTNHDEETGRIGAQESATGVPTTQAAYEAEVRRVFGADADRVLRRYAGISPPGLALSTVLTDALWAAPAYRSGQLLALRMPTYTFEFAGTAPWYAGLPRPGWPTGTYHASELTYLFDLKVFEPLDAGQRRLADEVIDRWSTFARTGRPNPAGTAYWPRTTPWDRSVQSLSPSGPDRTDFRADHRLAFWHSVG